MTYELAWNNGQDRFGETITVKKQSEILAALKDGYLMEGPNYSVRHHMMFSDVYMDGKIVVTAEWIDD